MRCSIRFFLSDHINMVLAPCKCESQGRSGAKRCQETPQIKIQHTKTVNLCGFGNFKIYKKCKKTLFKYREGGRTVGSCRVATILEQLIKNWILWGFLRILGKPFLRSVVEAANSYNRIITKFASRLKLFSKI